MVKKKKFSRLSELVTPTLVHYIRHTLSWYHNYLYPVPRQRLRKMPLDATFTDYLQMRVHAETTSQRDSSCLPTKMDSNAAKYCRLNDNGGKGVRDSFFYLCHGTDLIFFMNTVQRVLLLIRSIWVGKLFTVFILLLGRSEVILTSRLLSQLLNLLSIIERPRTIFNASSNFLLHC